MWYKVLSVVKSPKFWFPFLGGLVAGICGALGADPSAWQAVVAALKAALGG